jgi:hypothetical protein
MYKTLVLLELHVECFHVQIVARLQAEELEIVDLPKKVDVFQILAGVACQLLM